MARTRRIISRPLWEISITARPEAEDAVVALLQDSLRQPVTSWTDLESGRVCVSVFLQDKNAFSDAMRISVREGLRRIKSCGLDVGAGRISIKRLPPANWTESWKRHFKPIAIRDALLIKPSWSDRRPRKGQAVIVLDPGLSFGTGQHPTTKFCLRELVSRRNHARGQAVLDIGTGSGILAIAAAKLGYAPVQAFDFDPQSAQVASANARRNRVRDRIQIVRADLTKLPRRGVRQYDVICANLLADLLIAERERILSRLKPGGSLVIAGILKSEFSQVAAAYESVGFRLIAGRIEKEWRSGAFARA